MTPTLESPRQNTAAGIGFRILALIAIVAAATSAAGSPPLFAAILAITAMLIALPMVDFLCVATFWCLPYLAISVPTGAFTLRLPEVVAYLFAFTYLIRAVLRREQILPPPATAFVLVFLFTQCLSAILAPPIPLPLVGSFVGSLDRNSPNLRPTSIIIWLIISWLVVTAVYNIAGRSKEIFQRCVRAHILGSGLACLISLGFFVAALLGSSLSVLGRGLVFGSGTGDGGSILRLTGVALEPLVLAFYLNTALPVTIVVFLKQPPWMRRTISGPILCLQILAMILTFSAGGWGGLAAGLIILLPLLRKIQLPRKLVRTVTVVAACSAVFAGILLALNASYLKEIQIISQKVSSGGDAMRQQEFAMGIEIIKAYPIFGCGPGLPSFLAPKFSTQFLSQTIDGKTHEVNNVLINTAAESGVVGLLALISAGCAGVFALIHPILRVGAARLPILAAFVGSLLACAVQYMSMSPLFLIYFSGIIALACAAYRLADSESPLDILTIGEVR